eukprot:403346211
MHNHFIEKYKSFERDDQGWVAPRPYFPKCKGKITTTNILADPKPQKISYFDKRSKPEHKKKFRNYHKFIGLLPDFMQFEHVKSIRIMKFNHFREKRTFISIFNYFTPDVLMLKMKLVSKKFYSLSWSDELLTYMCFNVFGTELYEQVKYRIAKYLYKKKHNQPVEPRYFEENSTTDSGSDQYDSDEHDKPHIRQDGNSSADDENTLKTFFRRNAAEEVENERYMKKFEETRRKDMKKIEKLRHERQPLPEDLKEKYQDELTEYQHLRVNQAEPSTIVDQKKDPIKFKEQQRRRLEKQMIESKRRRRLKERAFTEQYITDGVEFKRKLLLFYSLKRKCSNCSYIDYGLDQNSNLIICQVLRKPLCYDCKFSDQFKLISATSFSRKYKVDKKDIDMLCLPYIDVPNPYYTAQKMKLYYEFMIAQNLNQIKKWRDFKKKKQSDLTKDHREWAKAAKIEKKEHETILAIEIEFNRHGDSKAINRSQIETIFIANPLMQRYIHGKTNQSLSTIVDIIRSGKSDEYEDKLVNRGVKMREAKHKKKEKEKKKKDKKDRKRQEEAKKKLKDMKKKDIERQIAEERRRKMMQSTMSFASKGEKVKKRHKNEIEEQEYIDVKNKMKIDAAFKKYSKTHKDIRQVYEKIKDPKKHKKQESSSDEEASDTDRSSDDSD